MLQKSDLLGWIGVLTSIISPYIDAITTVGKLVGAVGGIILVILSLYLKLLQIKKIKNEKDNSDIEGDL